MTDETKRTPEQLTNDVRAEIEACYAAIVAAQDEIQRLRAAIANARASKAEWERLLPRKPRTKKA